MAKLNLIETIETKLPTLTKTDGQLIVIRDNASLYVDLDGARIYISDWIDVSTDEERLAMLTPLSNKYYYVVETNKIWRYISGSWVLVTSKNYEDLNGKPQIEGVELVGNKTLADFGGKKQIRISWEDYQSLSTEEQNDESIVYYIYNYPNNVVNASDVAYDNTSSGLSATNVQDGVDELNNKVGVFGDTTLARSDNNLPILSGVDIFDSTLQSGRYYCQSSCSNLPNGNVGYLDVSRVNNLYVHLEYTELNGNKYLITQNNGTWKSWERDFPMPFKMKIYQQTLTPDSSGKVTIDASELNASVGFAFCTPLGNENAVVTVSNFTNCTTVTAYVKNVSTGGAHTNNIFITAYVFYV